MSSLPSNAYITPVDTRFSTKTIMLPDVASNPGRFVVFKDRYGNAGLSSIFLSTLSNNFFEQSSCNTYIANQPYGAWTLTNDGISRWIFTNIYSSNFYVYKRTPGILTSGLVFNYEGFNYTSNGFWADSVGGIHLSSGIGLAAPSVGLDVEGQNVPRFNGVNQYFRSFTPVTQPDLISSFTYNVWFSNSGTNGCIVNESPNPSTFISTQAINVLGTNTSLQIKAGYRAANGFIITNTGTFSATQWVNSCWTFNSTIMRLYVNGAFIQQQTVYTKSTNVTFYPQIGMGNPGVSQIAAPSQWAGLLGSVRLYSTILTPGQVIQNYNAEAYRYGLNQYPGF